MTTPARSRPPKPQGKLTAPLLAAAQLVGYPHEVLRPIQVLSLTLLLSTLACSGGTADDHESSATGSTGSGSTGSDSTGGGLSQTDACRRYIECVAETSPAAVGPLLESYGPAGTCWATTPEVAALCDSACEDALAMTATAFPDAEACQESTAGESRDGHFILAVDLTTFGSPVFFHALVTSSDDSHASIALQSYIQDNGAPTNMLTPNGPFVLEATVDGAGAFSTDMVTVTLPPGAQITATDVVLDLALVGSFGDSNTFCGEALGEITMPLNSSIDGSTFAATRIADAMTLPAEIPTNCGG